MKQARNIKSLIIMLVLLSFSGACVIGQGLDVRAKAKINRIFLGFELKPGVSQISHTGNQPISNLENSKKSSLSGTVEFGIQLNDNFSISTGVGYTSYASTILLSSYKDSLTNQQDADLDIYTRRITGTDISESQNIGMISLPVFLNGDIHLGKILGLYLQAGINLSVPAIRKYSSSGTMTYSGYYPAYNVEITGVIHEGFLEEAISSQDGTLTISQVIPEVVSSAGIRISLSENLQFITGFSYSKILSSITKYDPAEKFHLSIIQNEMNSLMAGSSSVSAQSVGLKIGLRYFLR